MGNGLSNNARLADGSQSTAVNELKMIGKVNSFYPGHPSVSRFHGQTMEELSEQKQRENYAQNVCQRSNG